MKRPEINHSQGDDGNEVIPSQRRSQQSIFSRYPMTGKKTMKTRTAHNARIFVVLLTLISFVSSWTLQGLAKHIVAPGKQPTRISTPAPDAPRLSASEAFGKLPLSFEKNQGQADPQVKFLSRGQGYMLFLKATEAVVALRTTEPGEGSETRRGKRARPSIDTDDQPLAAGKTKSAMLRMKLIGANPEAQLEGADSLQGRVNYLTSNDKTKWHTDVPTYARVHYSEVWPGVDMVWYGNQRQPEYDFIVAPGVSPTTIRLSFAGADEISLDQEGNLLLKTDAGTLTQAAPEIYQETEHGRQTIQGRYVLVGEREVGFAVGDYDTRKPLTIDPQLLYSSFYGGTGQDSISEVAVDGSGNAYFTGSTQSPNLVLDNPFHSSLDSAIDDAFVVKLNPAGTEIVYATYLGGSDFALGRDIAVTSDGRACVTGDTRNNGNTGDFPVTSGAYQDNGSILGNRGVDVFVTMLTAAGNGLVYSTFLGGDDSEGGSGIAVDAANKIYVVGDTLSRDFPTKNAFQRNPGGRGQHRDAFVAKFDPTQSGNSSLVYSTYLGGSTT